MDFSQLSIRRPARSRGFTLIELMVVVVIIGILASLAVPQIVERMRERRSGQAAQEIAMLYRNARLRALGQGFAVLVHYDPANGFVVREAIPTAAGAGNCFLQQTSCQDPTSWWTVPARYRVVNSFNTNSGLYQAVTETVSAPAATTNLDICFTPRGRTFASAVVGQPLTQMVSTADVAVTRGGASLVRHVAILPNGMSRLTL